MKLSIKALTIAAGLAWALGMFVAGVGHLLKPIFGTDFLAAMSSLYPGFHVARTWASVMIGTIYGFVDGSVSGFIFAWLYDLVTDGSLHRHA